MLTCDAMKAVILAGGLGTRISEETHLKPKPMIDIGGKPILWHIMKMYSAHGVNDFVICCGYRGYVIKEWFANYYLHSSDVTIDVGSGQTREIAAHWDRSADGIVVSKDGATIYTTAQDVGQHPLFAVDVASGTAKPVVAEGSISAFDIAGDTLAFTRNTLKTGDQLFTTTLAGAPLRAITPSAQDMLKDVSFGDFEQFTFAGWNNETVHGYVIKPANYVEGQKYPVAFLIHGGPQGSFGNSWSYRWNPSSYAGAGYAVVMIDFHGSTGYGQAFTDSIQNNWGGWPLEDLKKGLAAATAADASLDADNACALGASYGGYLTSILLGTEHPFKALLIHAAVYNMYSQMAADFAVHSTRFGNFWDNPEIYKSISPHYAAGNFNTPTLVIHGQLDYRVPVGQGFELGHGGRATVDPGTAFTLVVYGTPQKYRSFRINACFFQPWCNVVRNIELRADICFGCALPYNAGVSPCAQHDLKCIDQNGFTCPCFSCQNGKTRLQFEV